MRTNPYREAVFPQTITRTVADLKARLQHDYEQAYPNLAEIIHIVLDEEEAKAWELSFPHLFLPDLVEAHIAKLNLPPADTRHDDVIVPHDFTKPDAAPPRRRRSRKPHSAGCITRFLPRHALPRGRSSSIPDRQ